MDLKTLEGWAQHALEAEAARRGIRDAHLRTRAELVRLILQRASLRPLQRGRLRLKHELSKLSYMRAAVDETLDAALDAAIAIMPPGLRASLDPARGKEIVPTDQAAEPQRVKPQSQPLESKPASAEIAEATATASAADVVAAPGAVESEALASVAGEEAPRDVPQAQAPTLPTLNWVEPAAGIEVLGEQGLQCGPEAGDPLRVRVHYCVGEQGIRQAQAVLGAPGELAVRLVATLPDRESLARTEVQEQAPVSPAGAFVVGPLEGATRCVVALGLRSRERFVSITHTPLLG